MICGPEGRKVGSLKRQVRSHVVRWEMKNCTPLWCEAQFQVNMVKAHQVRTTFGSWDVEKVHAVVVPISKSKCTKHTNVGPLLKVEMSKKCTPLWREAHFQVKVIKAHQVWTTFGSWDVEKVHAVVAPSTFRSQKCKKKRGSDHFWTFKCRFAWQAQGILHLVKSEQKVTVFCNSFNCKYQCTTRHYSTIALHYPNYNYSYNYTTWTTTTSTTTTITLQCKTLHYTRLNYTTLQLHLQLQVQVQLQLQHTTTTTTWHYTTLRYTNYITLHYTTPHSIPLHSISLHSTTLYYTTLTSTTATTTTAPR